MKIGLFDSGLGGLVILKAVTAALSQYDYEYYGDTKNLPYGEKTEEEIYNFTKQGVEHLFSRGCVLVVLACNTASAETLRRLQDDWLEVAYPGRKILGVIVPVIEEVTASSCKRVLLIATTRTVSSGKYHLELGKRQHIETKIEALATPELVPLIEAGKEDEAMSRVISIINARQSGGLDGLILGCTHYSLLADQLKIHYGEQLTIFSQTDIVPNKLAAYLEVHTEIKAKLSVGGGRNIYLTEHRPDYDRFVEEILGGRLLQSDD